MADEQGSSPQVQPFDTDMADGTGGVENTGIAAEFVGPQQDAATVDSAPIGEIDAIILGKAVDPLVIAALFPGLTTEYFNLAEESRVRDIKKRLLNPLDVDYVVTPRTSPSIRRQLSETGARTILVDGGPITTGTEMSAAYFSYFIDKIAPHHDASRPSDLEQLLQSHDFSNDAALVERAAALRAKFVAAGLSRVNHLMRQPETMLGVDGSGRRRVLIIAQDVTDPSVGLSNPREYTMNDMVRIAMREFPDAQMLLQNYPGDIRARDDDVDQVVQRMPDIHVVPDDVPFEQILGTVDQVMTISSIGGFEAAMRAIPVTVLGAPFYAGWGITDDRSPIERRNRKLSIDEIFAAAYMLSPVYYDSLYRQAVPAQVAIDALCLELSRRADRRAPGAMRTLVFSSDLDPALAEKLLGPGSVVTLDPLASGPSALLRTNLDGFTNARLALHRSAPDGLRGAATMVAAAMIELDDGFLCFANKMQKSHSLLIDALAPHYDAGRASSLEVLLATYDFDGDANLMTRAQALLETVVREGVGKYNGFAPVPDLPGIYGPKTGKRVFILGQCAGDRALALSNPKHYSHLDVMRIAEREHPGAQIIYQTHPHTSKAELAEIRASARAIPDLLVVSQQMPLSQVLETADHIVTISAGAGFDALLRGLPVTVLGAPFYAGWGLSDDRNAPARRTRALTRVQLFAAACILYPIYFDPLYKQCITPEEAVDILVQEVRRASAAPRPLPAVVRPVVTNAASPVADMDSLPAWFRQRPAQPLADALGSGLPLYLYMPWIAEHGDVLMPRLASKDDYIIAPFDIVDGVEDNEVRRQAFHFAREHPEIYRKFLLRRLVPLRKHVKAFILTFDWAPIMRLIAEICRDLAIPTVLIPHESVFVDRNKYYWDPRAFASVPFSDVVLGWGGMQRDIYLERGFPADRFTAVGAPKFDTYFDFEPNLTREQYCRIYGLDPAKKIALFATQPLDSQLNTKIARNSQRSAMTDLIEQSLRLDCQVILRLPPSKDDVVGTKLRNMASANRSIAIDDSTCYLTTPEESLYHADIILSINSTMLFEGVLMGRQAISMKYVDFDQIWQPLDMPAPRNKAEFIPAFEAALADAWTPSADGMQWAADEFGPGVFDGQATARIRDHLRTWSKTGGPAIAPRATERLASDGPLDVIAVAGLHDGRSADLLRRMVNARTIIPISGPVNSMIEMASVELFFDFGDGSADSRTMAEIAGSLGRPVVTVSPGFLNDIFPDETGVVRSVFIDERSDFGDAGRVSQLEGLLEKGPALTAGEAARAKGAIDQLLSARIEGATWYPDAKLAIGEDGRPTLLILDECVGDPRIAGGLADQATFERMLLDAVRSRGDHDIIVKWHPDAVAGLKRPCLSRERIDEIRKLSSNIILIDYDISIFALLDLAPEVWVVTAAHGLHALMSGRPVRCYGLPYYAGWQLTQDMMPAERRTRARTIEDLFHFACIALGRYGDAEGDAITIETAIAAIGQARGW